MGIAHANASSSHDGPLSFSLFRNQENSKHPWQFLYGNASSSYDGSPPLSRGDRDWQNIMGIANANASSSYDASLSPSPSKHQETIQHQWPLFYSAVLQAAMLALLLSLVETETGRTAWALPMPMLQAAMMALSLVLFLQASRNF